MADPRSAKAGLTAEEVRILRAAGDGRLGQNEHGRWVIEGEPRPVRKDRERLLYGGLIRWPHFKTGETITSEGRDALAALSQQRETSPSDVQGLDESVVSGVASDPRHGKGSLVLADAPDTTNGTAGVSQPHRGIGPIDQASLLAAAAHETRVPLATPDAITVLGALRDMGYELRHTDPTNDANDKEKQHA